ncbi:M16 family metallopeptidase [Undibacterium pigrum]|uniref:Putative Zn-dependent peptidase n=1 Tax=Undibacterium pigrum TaxID=401470 RepID=A0A318J4I2_9BURK|nr:pitrilysin family protein [Undibacterium pigrum]PXX41601.1 putative Zn-dependent peptidase [Undibacterium pigrum]
MSWYFAEIAKYILVVLLMTFNIHAFAVDLQVIVPAQKVDVQLVREVEGIREFKLANGLQILLIGDEHRSYTTMNLVYRTGSKQENYGQKGLAHLLEHLIYTGGSTHPDISVEYRQRNMMTMGLTSFDFTSYRTTLDAGQHTLDWVLELEAARMSQFKFSDDNLLVALREVLGEKENTDASGKNALIRRATLPLFFWDAYGKEPIGIPSDLKNMTLNDLQNFWETYYRPDNATLIVSGKFNEKNLLSSVVKIFGPIQKLKPLIRSVYTTEPTQDGEREIVKRRKRGAAALMLAYRTEPYIHPDAAAAMLLGQIFGNGKFGRLQDALIKTKIAKRTAAHVMYMEHAGALLFGVDQEYGLPIDEAKSTLLNTLENVRHQPLTQSELDQAKQILGNAYIDSRKDTDALTTELNNFIGSGDWRLYFLMRERIQHMDLGNIQRIAESWFVPTNRSLCILIEDQNMVLRNSSNTLDVEEQLREFEKKQTGPSIH